MDPEIEHRLFCVESSKLVKDFPDVLRFSLEYFRRNPPPWSSGSELREPLSKRIKMSDNCDMLESMFLYLQTYSDYFRNHWKWSDFIRQFFETDDMYCKWLFCQCLSTFIYATESQRHQLNRLWSSNTDIWDATIRYFRREIAGELCLSDSFLPDKNKISSNLNRLNKIMEKHSDSCLVSGIKLPAIGDRQVMDLILVDSTVNNLRGLALAVAAGKPVCLCGPVGCGKTALVQYLASVTGYASKHKLHQVQLGEEMDSKLLLGSYKCTDVPGEFIWQPGVLTKAVIDGDWLLFEDIDTATNDVVTLLVSLIERNSLNVPGYRDNLIPAPGFQMFFTQRFVSSVSGYFQQTSAITELLRKYWVQLNMEPLSREELEQLIVAKYPVLSTISSRMVKVFLMFSVGLHGKGRSSLQPDINDVFESKGRLTSTRDLLKWCSRSIIGYDVKSQDSALNVIQNAIDLFCCNVGDEETRLKLATAITTHLGVVKTKAEYFCKQYKPKISLERDRCVAGRATLERSQKLADDPAVLDLSNKLYFAMTRPSCCLMERVACCLSLNEPVLLVGETGTGKTSTLQLLAKHTGNTLVVLNMNQQSDSIDLLGGYKPVDVKYVISFLRDEFEELFRNIFDLVSKNLKFLNHISNCFNKQDWGSLVALMKHVKDTVIAKKHLKGEQLSVWKDFGNKLARLESQLKHNRALAFAFIEGALVRALKQGHWVLLDEINLASAETLQCLSGMLEMNGTLSLYEKGEFEPVKRHENFRLMAAMNPATDVGKKQLPAGIRNRFTEFYVDELNDRSDLITLIACYLREFPAEKINAISKFYLKVRQLSQTVLSDGTGHKPHYSLRTLCRALSIVAANSCKNVQRSLYEGFCLSFLTQLDASSHQEVVNLIVSILIGTKNIQGVLTQKIPEPEPVGNHVCFEGYWVSSGSVPISVSQKYILTPSVKKNLKDLVRVVSLSNHPILLQGDTSVGKTSLISFLASASGNKCLRINNHEHTDLQEYIGAYSVDAENGQLVFKEGVLVEAMRHGYWIILDELNLAPSDVLEALNRVLDDNRELYIPETQVAIKANPKFRLFATQNPPGLYGGRKVLSRAFRNRFIELHFCEIPSPELEIILQNRCDMPASYSKKIVCVMKELQAHRRSSAAFAGKQGFITLRDLFRWGERYRLASSHLSKSLYDWDQHLADEGFLVLAGRVRKLEEAEIVITAIEKHLKRKVNVENLFTLSDSTSVVTRHVLESITKLSLPGFEHVVWTYNLRKLAVLVGKAIEFQEPVLLVGDTGCGKTTICQYIAAARKQKLFIVNCHQHSESSDFLGGLRPVRNHSEGDSRLFEWIDGPLIEAMRRGDLFLADEISLADDSVLERLNSLLEPERMLLLSEKSSNDLESGEIITAHPEFYFLSTMNPGGDYGKKELSPALRNRLTEIWCESCDDDDDRIAIIEHNVKDGLCFGNQEDGSSGIGKTIINFINWFQQQEFGKKIIVSIRDLLLWIKFINVTIDEDSKTTITSVFAKLCLAEAYIHGAHLVFLDSLGTGISNNYQEQLLKSRRESASNFLSDQMKSFGYEDNVIFSSSKVLECKTDDYFGIHPFYIEKGDLYVDEEPGHSDFTFRAQTTKENLVRLLRSLQLPGRAVLLEGSPGVGKTSLVQALANAAGYPLTRINLSEQTDVSDLFGADLPVDGAEGGVFAWRDGPFLKALKDGHWILLDELNLASQSVLEGLNAVLDHRGELYIPELGRTFTLNSLKTRLFACQNPLRQGGARKGLPASFLNRFTQVYMEPLNDEDILFILTSLHPEIPSQLLERMVRFNYALTKDCGITWGLRGAPWEMNLRDLLRWCQVMKKYSKNGSFESGRFVSLIYADRMRTVLDKEKVLAIYEETFGSEYPLMNISSPIVITPEVVILDDIVMNRGSLTDRSLAPVVDRKHAKLLLRNQLRVLRSLAVSIEMNWFVVLVGGSGSGKTSVVQVISQLCNEKLEVLSVNSAMDTMDILGGFEQVDYNRHLEQIVTQVEEILFSTIQALVLKRTPMPGSVADIGSKVVELMEEWEQFKSIGQNENKYQSETTLAAETEVFRSRISALFRLIDAIDSHQLPSYRQQLVTLHTKLVQLERDVDKIGSLNSGGKFEWVDSVLIRCLTEGRWLLVENVNLCSPAILDRLNGLLEAGGVLTLGEKGVDYKGDLVTITPHPNFRLFFTMDPQRGEISRAMRNRGLEIFLPAIDEDLDGNIMDILSILRHSGLLLHSTIMKLLDVHFAIYDLNIGLDHVSIGHLIHACFLFVQHHHRHGKSVEDSLKIVCFDVYLKSRSLSFEQQEIVSNVLTDALNSTNKDDCVPPFYAAINTQQLQYNSALCISESSGAMLSVLIYLLSRQISPSYVSEVLFSRSSLSTKFQKHFDFNELDYQNLVLFGLSQFYEMASADDAKYRHFWLTELMNNQTLQLPDSLDLIAISEKLSNLVDKKSDVSLSNCSMDLRYVPWDLRRLSKFVVSAVDNFDANKFSLMINYAVLKHRHLSQFIPSNCEDFGVTLSQYSLACSSEKIPVGQTIDGLLTLHYNALVSNIDDFFSAVLSADLFCIDEKIFELLLKSFQHYNRFVAAGSMQFFSRKNSRINDSVINFLKIHFKWTVKWIRKVIFKSSATFSEIKNLPATVKFLQTLHAIESASDYNLTAVLSFSKKLKRVIGNPLPLNSSECRSDSSRLSQWFTCSNRNDFDSQEIRNELCHVLCRSNSVEDATKIVPMVINDENVNTDDTIVEDESKSLEPVKENIIYAAYKYPLEMIPILEGMFLKLETNYKNFVFSKCTDELSKYEDLTFSEKISSQYPTFSQDLLFIPSKYSLTSELKDRSSLMIWYSSMIKHTRSFSTFSFTNYLKFRHETSDTDEDTSKFEHSTLLPYHLPVLSKFESDFMFSKKENELLPSLYMPSLKNFRTHQKMLHQLKELLWKNSAFLSHSKSTYLSNERYHVSSQFRFFMKSSFAVFTSETLAPVDISSSTAVRDYVEKLTEFIIKKCMSDKAHISVELDQLLHVIASRLEELMECIKDVEKMDSLEDTQQWILIGRCCVLLGSIQFILFSIFETIDPVVKVQMRKADCNDDLEFVRCRLTIERTSEIFNGYNSRFPYQQLYEDWSQVIENKLKTCPEELFVRNEPANYFEITKVVQQFRSNIGSADNIFKLYSKITQTYEKLKPDSNKSVFMECQKIMKECRSWLASSDRFLTSLNQDYPEYIDIIAPITYSVEQLNYGMNILISCLQKMTISSKILKLVSVNDYRVIQNMCLDLCSFPRSLTSYIGVVNLCSSECLAKLLTNNPSDVLDTSDVVIGLIKSSLREIYCSLSAIGDTKTETKNELWSTVKLLLDQVVHLWKVQEKKLQEKKENEENLYVFKTRTLCENVSEEEELKSHLNEFFNPSLDQDFYAQNTEPFDDPVEVPEDPKKSDIFLSEEEMNVVCGIHAQLAKSFTYSHWYRPVLSSDESIRSSMVDSLCERYRLFAAVLNQYDGALNEVVDVMSLPSTVIMSDVAQKFTEKDKSCDFYHSPDVEQVALFYPILIRVRDQAENLLKTWEDHPVLSKVIIVVDRIMSFEVNSPVSRFLTGADVLLKTLHEWEEVAHSRISFSVLYQELTGLIFMWRKMELSFWKNALENVVQQMKKRTSKWWFHLYAVSTQYMNQDDEEAFSFADLVVVLQKFMESSVLGEYTSKLDLLLVFHCHYVNQPRTSRLDELCSALWNLHLYYKQFEEHISTHINNLGAAVRKNLNDLVKITRWNDINYWSVVKGVEKTHEQLMKHIKEYQKILEMPAASAMTILQCPIESSNTCLSMLDEAVYVTQLSIADESRETDPVNAKLFSKAKKLCRLVVSASKYQPLNSSLFDVVSSIHEDRTVLNRMDIDRTTSKEKQRSQAKNLLQQKRKVVADLFKSLDHLGLSYRTGIIISKKTNFSVNFAHMKPFDLNQLYAGDRISSTQEQILKSWSNCSRNYLNSIAKQAQLKLALEKPHADLGPRNTDRINGFANHLLDMIMQKKSILIDAVVNLSSLEKFEKVLPELCCESFSNEDEKLLLKEKYIDTLHESIHFYQQFLTLLDCCPENDSNTMIRTPVIRVDDDGDHLIYVNKSDPLWTDVRNRMENGLRIVQSLKNKFFENISSSFDGNQIYEQIVTQNQHNLMFSEKEKLESLLADLKYITTTFGYRESDQCNVLCQAAVTLATSFEALLDCISSYTTNVVENTDADDVERRIENLRKKILISIQELYKKFCTTVEDEGTEKTDEGGPKKNYLKELVYESLNSDLELLGLKKMCLRTSASVSAFIQKPGFDSITRRRLLEPLIPLLNQYRLLSEFIITQYVTAFNVSTQICTALLNLFIDLTVKGFCIPPELLEDEKEGKNSDEKGGMGLADGEGQKDVSDQIESQDQLEDAKPAGQEEQQEEKDCKEEENGIEMSEDFGGKSQNLEQKEEDGDSEGDEEDGDELDKEMGETGDGAETLDQQIWGDESEDEEADEDGKEDDGKDDRGEETGDAQMGAKDERTKEYEERVDGKEGDKKEEKEINEMDDQEKDDDQIDPYHGKQDPLPEPEALDLPEDLQLDDGEAKDNDQNEENPFDVDAMKELLPPKDTEEEKADETADEPNEETKSEEETEEGDEDEEVGKKRNEENDETGEEELPEDVEEEKEDGGSKDDDKSGEEPKPEEMNPEKQEEEAGASKEDASEATAEPAENKTDGSKDMVNQKAKDDKDSYEPEDESKNDTSGVEQQGVGQADKPETDTDKGHSAAENRGSQSREKGGKEQKRKLKPGDSDSNRTLADNPEPIKKRLKTIDTPEQPEDELNEGADDLQEEKDESGLYKHIRDAEKSTNETIDAATQEQAEKQPVLGEENDEEVKEDDQMDIDDDEEENTPDEISIQKADKIKSSKPDKNKRNESETELPNEEELPLDVKVEGEYVDTMTVERGLDTTFHTLDTEDEPNKEQYLSLEYINSLKSKVQDQLASWSQTPAVHEATVAWEMFSAITSNLSQELCEQLRLVLEPTQATRLKGDFRTGRRINMRKVIPYVASQFRKDKIWLRRTKPSKREYQIILAIDDSSSMADNHSKELAFESVALVSRALSLIEAGELGVISFGERSRVLHPLGEPFTTQTGAKLVREFTFDETETKFADAVHTANGLFLTRGSSSRAAKTAQLLVIVSDGRGVSSEGSAAVRNAIRTAKQAGIFIVFIIVENPNMKNSILDIRMPVFSDNKLVSIESYIENFPFPFYLILRDINKLPAVLAEALQQWFELVTNSSV